VCDNASHSTGEFAINAGWTEFLDLLHEPEPRTEPRGGHVADRKVDYEEPLALFPKLDGEAPPRHELGDTKHRNVKYRAVGTTRYREYFPPALTKWKELITAEGPETLVNVLSSERPEIPRVLYIVPTFKWVDGPSGRSRKGRGLRIYLDRPWFSSGEGERLGFVLKPASGPFAPVAQQYISEWGADPLFDRIGPTTPLAPANFTYESGEPDAVPPVTSGPVRLAEVVQDVRVVGYQPYFDKDRKLWYVDLELLPTTAYYTFVRFALCRYQPDALVGCHISRVVKAEFAQLLADRTATLTYGVDTIGITVSGPSALSKVGEDVNAATGLGGGVRVAPGRSEAARGGGPDVLGDAASAGGGAPASRSAQAPAPIGPIGPPVDPPIIVEPGIYPNPEAGAGHRLTATIEWRPEGTPGDLGWQPLDGGLLLGSYTSLISTTLVFWKGTLRWPRKGLPPKREWRLVLREFDLLYTDDETAEGLPSSTGQSVRGRLAYVDVFPLAAP
jgi:hypothetical protein